MRFNATQCNIMCLSWKRTPFTFTYSLTGEPLQEIADAKYLAAPLATKHIQNITAKGNSKLAFLRRNLSSCPEKLKVLEKCTKNLIGHSRLAFNNHESNIDC